MLILNGGGFGNPPNSAPNTAPNTRKDMKAIHAQNNVELSVTKRQCANFALHGLDMMKTACQESFLSMKQHVLTVIDALDPCVFHPFRIDHEEI